jgi:hypothetical protein
LAASSEGTFGTWPTESWFSCFAAYTDGAHEENEQCSHGRAFTVATSTVLKRLTLVLQPGSYKMSCALPVYTGTSKEEGSTKPVRG